jgi:hypothetical protein
MSAHYLISSPRKHQVANLRPSIHTVDMRERKCVPETDALVSCATSCSQQSSLLGTPPYGFNSCLVLTEPR